MDNQDKTAHLMISKRAEHALGDLFRALDETQGPRDALPILIVCFYIGYAEAMHRAPDFVSKLKIAELNDEEKDVLEGLILDSAVIKLTAIAGISSTCLTRTTAHEQRTDKDHEALGQTPSR